MPQRSRPPGRHRLNDFDRPGVPAGAGKHHEFTEALAGQVAIRVARGEVQQATSLLLLATPRPGMPDAR